MAEHDPTPAQQAAIVATGSIAVRAGAGSGKTTVLAERFVHLLRPATHVDREPEVARLLAITFTERAAAEMRTRIQALVAREGERNPADRRHWTRIQRELSGAQISTIHAFCARLVREYPMQTGVDPDARVLDADEARRYLDARVEHHLLDLVAADHPGGRALLRRGRGLRGGRGGGAVGLVVGLLDGVARAGRRPAWLRGARPPGETSESDVDALLATLCAAVDQRLAGAAAGRRTPKLAQLAEAWPRGRDLLRRFGRADADALSRIAGEVGELAAAISAARVRGVGDLLKRATGKLQGRLAEAVASRAAGPEARAIADLLATIDDLLREDKRRDAVLTFDDLVLGARDLLVGGAAARRAVARRFDAVLLDECQDTDPAQAELLRAITAEGGPEWFVVGDEKQAIYGFRGADVEVFERLLAELPARVTLGRNFRSVPSILAFVNTMAAHVLALPEDGAPEHALTAHREEAAPPTAVRVVTAAHELARRGHPRAAARRELEAEIVAGVVRNLLHDATCPVRPGGVAVLFSSLREVKVYEHALARRGLPYHVVGGRGFFQRQEVRDVVNLLAVVADPRDEIALAAVLRSPWVALGDDVVWQLVRDHGSLRLAVEGGANVGGAPAELTRVRTVLAELRALRSRGAIVEVLVEAVESLDLDAVLLALPQGDQRAANVRKVLELARAFEQASRGGLPEFVAWMRRRDADDLDEPEALLASEDADVVRLMTIHQAKGLEFPVVILPDLGRSVPGPRSVLTVDGSEGIVVAPLVGAGGHAIMTTELRAHRERRAAAERAERGRLFYVACTRARDRLVLVDGTTPAKWLCGDGGPGESWGDVLWQVLGPERVLAAGAAGEPTVMEIDGGARVLVEPADRWLTEAKEETPPGSAPGPAFEDDGDLESVVDAVATPLEPAATVTECTPTDLAEFRVCPRRWWYGSVVGLEEPGRGGRRSRVLGSLVHAALDRWASRPSLDAEQALGPALPTRVADPGQRAEVLHHVAQAIEWLGAEREAGTRLLGREVPFVMALASDVVVRGRIDVVLVRGDEVVVRDYKYARPGAGVADPYRDQLAVYAAAMARAGYDRLRAELLFLRPSPSLRAVPLPRPVDAPGPFVDVARRIGALRRARDREPAPRGPTSPDGCRDVGCGWIRRCWSQR